MANDSRVVMRLLSLNPFALGASTGWNASARGDWKTLLAAADRFNPRCVELSALHVDELPSLAAFVSGMRAYDGHLSFHGPAKGMADADIEHVVSQLDALSGPVVMHPDTMGDLSNYHCLGERLLIENMDARKPVGTSAATLAGVFSSLPAARFCLDVAHVASLDPTLALGHQLLDAFSDRLVEVHISSVDSGCHHVPTTVADVDRYLPLLARCTAVPWILESAPAE